jgi:hypothetical protein
MTNRIKSMAVLGAGLALFMTVSAFGQVPSAVKSTTVQSSTSAGRFGADIDNYMGTRSGIGVEFDRHFFFLGGRYQGTVSPSLGYATRFGDYYLGLYFKGTVVQGANTHHNAPWDSTWDKDGNGESSFTLNDNFAVLFAVPGIGGFRFDWVASDSSGTSGPSFGKFKEKTKTFNGQSVDYAEGDTAGSMSFLLSYGNVFLGNIKADAVIGFATPDTTNVTGGQVAADVFKFNRTAGSKVYIKLGGGYNLDDTSSVDGDYSLIIMPGEKWEQTLGSAETSKEAEGNFQHIINLSYSKTFNLDEKIALKIKPNISLDILLEKDIYQSGSGKVDNGSQTTLTLIPAVAGGLQYKAAKKLTLYTGTTVTLFNLAARSMEKGADGATYDDGSSSDIIEASESGFDIGASFAISDNASLDFNVRQLINGIFVASPQVDLFLTIKK